MSEVISFRLDKENPREAKALEILRTWTERGYSTRFIITKGLLELNNPNSSSEFSRDDQIIEVVLEQIGQVLDMVKSMNTNPSGYNRQEDHQDDLSKDFIKSIKLGIKPGIRTLGKSK